MSQKRKQISLEQKLEVLKRFESGEKAVDIARNLRLAPTTVRTICKRDADQIREFAKTATPWQSKQTSTKVRSSIMVKMESLLSIWIENQKRRRMPLSKMIIQNKALSIFNDIRKYSPSSSGKNLEKFVASQGWFERFKSRTNLHYIALKGKSTSADIAAANKYKREKDLISINIECSLEDDIDTLDVVPEEKQLTAGCILKAMQLISQAMDIFVDNDPDANRSSEVTRSIGNVVNCYKEIYLEKQATKVPQTLDNILTKSVLELNQSTGNSIIDLESSSIELESSKNNNLYIHHRRQKNNSVL